MLDGLEGESNKRICVMMTTMDVASVPPALVRSGRIELWLETRLPEREARVEILKEQAKNLPDELRSIDIEFLADSSEGLTGADLRRLIEDGKLLYAYDRARELPISELSSYFEKAIETIRSNKEKYALAEMMAKGRQGDGSDFSSMMGSMMSSMSTMCGGGGGSSFLGNFNFNDDDDDDD
jgi:ATP-dependent 26S proteasome regulatory subunit